METQRQMPVTVTSQGKSKRLPNFKGGVATCTSIMHVIIGVLVIIFESVAKQNNAHLSYTLMGVWTGLFFILTGCVGIGAGRTKLKRLIVTFLVLSAVCIVLAVGLMAYSGFAMTLNFGGYSGIDTSDMYAANNHTVMVENIQGADEKQWNQGIIQYAHKPNIKSGMNFATLAIAGVEFIIGIISAVFCCIGYCGKPLEQTQVKQWTKRFQMTSHGKSLCSYINQRRKLFWIRSHRPRRWRRMLCYLAATLYCLLLVFSLTNYCFRCREDMPDMMFDQTVTDFTEDGHCRLDKTQLLLRKADTWTPKNMSQIESDLSDVQPGGTWRPSSCKPWQHVAIVIPYRERRAQLKVLLQTIHPMLHLQKIYYKIFVVEQSGNLGFNRGKLMNIGASEALKEGDFDCFIFHDVDLIPEHDQNIYYCNEHVRHLSPAIDELRYHLMYYQMLGGVTAVNKDNFFKVNGFPMVYFSWGAEDDDFSARTEMCGLQISRPPNYIGRYKMIKHEKQRKTAVRYDAFLQWRRRWSSDGIRTLKSTDYKIVSNQEKKLYTHLLVDLGELPAESPVDPNQPKESLFWFLKHFFS